MKLLLLFSMASILACSCHQRFQIGIPKSQFSARHEAKVSSQSVVDLQVQRLSGSRVYISWHTEAKNSPNGFDVMRKVGSNSVYKKVASVKTSSSNITDYSLTDINEFADSSFYSIVQRDERGAMYYSKARGVEGKGKRK